MKMTQVLCLGALICFSSLTFAATAPPTPPKPCKVIPGCDLSQLRSDKSLSQLLKFGTDPAGLSAESIGDNSKVMDALKAYTRTNKCPIFVLSLDDMIKGLFGESDILNQGKDKDSKTNEAVNAIKTKELSKFQGKYLIIDADQAECVKKLGLQLPLKKIEG